MGRPPFTEKTGGNRNEGERIAKPVKAEGRGGREEEEVRKVGAGVVVRDQMDCLLANPSRRENKGGSSEISKQELRIRDRGR